MPNWNCRLIERNDEPNVLAWQTIDAHNPQRAAAAYCHSGRVWDHVSWHEDDTGVVEVEAHGGEGKVHRMSVAAYTSLEFSAEPICETGPV